MKQQRGSVTVIALIMLLFLVIVGGAWTIMMTQEKTNAFADEKQQQAWYAAEAGYKRAAILLTRSKTEWVDNNTDWSWTTYDATKFKSKSESDLTKISLSDGSKLTDDTKVKTLPWYAVHVYDKTNNSDIGETYTRPTSGATTYVITAIGEYMGERKVISREVTMNITGGGGGGGGTSTATVPEGFVIAGGTITINKSYETFTRTDSKSLFVSGKLVDNGKGNSGTIDGVNSNANLHKYWNNSNSVDNFAIYSYMPDSMFEIPSTATQLYLTDGGANKAVTAGSTYYMKDLLYKDWKGLDQTWNGSVNLDCSSGGNGTTIYFSNACCNKLKTQGINGIKGPTSGEPLTLIFDGDMSFSGLEITGYVRVLVNGTLYIYNGSGKGLAMFLSNGDMTLSQSFGNASAPVFLSSNGSITISGALTGRMQAKNNITFDKGSDGNKYTYSNAVLDAFPLPSGLEVDPNS